MSTDQEKDELQVELLGSLLSFTQIFYKLRTGRDFEVHTPPGRESHIVTICRELVRVIKGEVKRLIINVPPRYGKAIDVNTPILTKEGWKAAHEVEKGDCLIGSSSVTRVIGKYPQGVLKAKKVTFSDGQSIICNEEHLWNVSDRYTNKFKTFKTNYIEKTIIEADGHKHWRIPLIDGEYGEIEPFIDPYLFGCWLGDGNSYYAGITTMDYEIVEAFEREGHTLRKFKHQNAGKAFSYGISKNGFSSVLRKHGLLGNKHFPSNAFHWSKENRIALLQGLMDTDGTCGKNGQVSFTNTNHNLIDGMGYLINSIGGIYRTYTRKSGIKTLNIRLPDKIKPFRLERKNKYVSSGKKCEPRRFIKSIEDFNSVEMVCFEVDASDKLFAAGEGLILTHNTELLIHFVTWAMARYPDSNFLYVSYSHTLASKQTKTIRDIVSMPQYRKMFHVELSKETKARDNFETDRGGSVYAAGSGGTITGRGAGIFGCDRFGGAIVIDDIHKPDEVMSDTIREGVINWYDNTMQSRLNNGKDTPIIFIGQRLHEYDLPGKMLDRDDWESVIIPALDEREYPLLPQLHNKEDLLKLKKESPYVFASQYQQSPQPAGGTVFKPEWFRLLPENPKIINTFLTVDTAETSKSYNDPTVFSFWGLYKIDFAGIETEMYGLHWIDCAELWVEPKDLESEFLSFYSDCMRFEKKPEFVAIEKKSTGTTLISVLETIPGLQVMNVERTRISGSKADRFLEIQSYIARKHISLPKFAQHSSKCIEHCRKITLNDTHRHDDIADTLYDAVKIALIDQLVIKRVKRESLNNSDTVGAKILKDQQRINRLRERSNQTWQ